MSPSPFVAEWVARLAQDGAAAGTRRALDVAMGRGRHALLLAREGYRTFGVDAKLDAVRDAVALARREGRKLQAWCADLTQHPLPRGAFDLIVVTRYLQRDLFGALKAAAAPGGVVLYETFTTAQRALGGGPTSPDHLLNPRELQRHFEDFETVFYEEVIATEALAHIVARRP